MYHTHRLVCTCGGEILSHSHTHACTHSDPYVHARTHTQWQYTHTCTHSHPYVRAHTHTYLLIYPVGVTNERVSNSLTVHSAYSMWHSINLHQGSIKSLKDTSLMLPTHVPAPLHSIDKLTDYSPYIIKIGRASCRERV